jgi:AcrR family transcriptional regulator
MTRLQRKDYMPPRPAVNKMPIRRRDTHRTKMRIIEAAKDLFAAQGYAQAGLREIAAQAKVAVSLLPQHFGSKADLFEAALLDAMAESTILDAPNRQWGAAMIGYMSGHGEVRLPAMVILSTGDAEAREITARVIRERLIPQLAERLGPPDALSRAMRITMLSTGFLIYGRQLPIGPVDKRTKDHFAQLIQAIVDGGQA